MKLRTVIINIIAAVLWLVVVYILCSLVSHSLNPVNWNEYSLAVMVIIALIWFLTSNKKHRR